MISYIASCTKKAFNADCMSKSEALIGVTMFALLGALWVVVMSCLLAFIITSTLKLIF